MNMTAKEKYIEALRSTPPLKYLSALSQSRITPSQKESIEKMQTELKDEVINAIIDYVMRKNGYRFSGAYAEKIGETLGMNGITTAEDALRFFSSIMKKVKKPEPPKEEMSLEEMERELDELWKSLEVPRPLDFDWDLVATEEEKKFIETCTDKEKLKALTKIWDERVIAGRKNGTIPA